MTHTTYRCCPICCAVFVGRGDTPRRAAADAYGRMRCHRNKQHPTEQK